MSVGVLEDAATGLNGGEGMADETIWVDDTEQPWRFDRYTKHYERLTDSGWRSGTPSGPLRKANSVPATTPVSTISNRVVATADHNTYFIEGGPGDSAYQIAVSHGFVGTEAEWIESLQGEPGPPGQGVQILSEEPAGDIDGDNDVFTTAQAFRTGTAAVYLNGLREFHYTETDSTTITLSDPPSIGDAVRVDYIAL